MNLAFDGRARISATLLNVTRELAKRYRFLNNCFAPIDSDDWQPLTDVDLIRFRIELESAGFARIGRSKIREAVRALSVAA